MAKDVFHHVVKNALQKDGWSIIDPLRLKIGTVERAIDLGADRLVGAERAGEKIAVEIKSFLENASAISEFHTALEDVLKVLLFVAKVWIPPNPP